MILRTALILILMLINSVSICFGRSPITGDRYEILTGVRGGYIKLDGFKRNVILDSDIHYQFLLDNLNYLVPRAKVLIVNMDEKGGALFLKQQGYEVFSFSPSKYNKKNIFDAAICMNMDLISQDVFNLVRPHGIIFFTKRSMGGVPLLREFKSLKILKYEAPFKNNLSEKIILQKRRKL